MRKNLIRRPKVVFVRPPNLQKSGLWKKQGVIRSPLNLALLAAYIREKGNYECSIVDFEVVPAINAKQMAETILKEEPKYVCLTTLTPRHPILVKISEELKKLKSDIVNIVGGPHITGAPKTSLYHGIDYGIVGEGEEALIELLDCMENGIKPSRIDNLLYKEGDHIIINKTRPFIKDLDGLPLPAWDLMTIDEYLDPIYFEGSHMGVFTGRGCPYDCIFCASNVTWKRKIRLRSVENVIRELNYIRNKLNVRNVMYFDDNFDADKRRALELCNKMIEQKIDIKYTVQIRADSISPELAIALKKSGCLFLAIGVESGNAGMLRKIGKRETKGQIKKGVRILKEIGLPVISSYIIGLPGDNHETIKETIDFAFELNTDQMKFMLLAPVPGTRAYDIALEKNLVDPTNFEQMEGTSFYDSVSINLSDISAEDLIRYQDEAYARFDNLRKLR